MGTATHNYGWGKPVVGGDNSTWGGELNATFDAIDGDLHDVSVSVGSVNTQLTANSLTLDKPTVPAMNIIWGKLGGVVRWVVNLGDATPEGGGGSNSGSNFEISRHNDSGAYMDQPITISRQTGIVLLGKNPVGPMDAATKGYVDSHGVTVGSVMMFAGPVPADYLACDGSRHLNASAPALAAAIGARFGGDATHFNVPNLAAQPGLTFAIRYQ